MSMKFLLKTVLWGFAACKCWILETKVAWIVEEKAFTGWRGVWREFLSRKQWRSCCGICHKSQAQLLCFSSESAGDTIVEGRDSVCGSVPTPPERLRAGLASAVLQVLEIPLSQKQEGRQGPDPLCCAWHHLVVPHPDPPSPVAPPGSLLRLLLFWMFFPGLAALCLWGEVGGRGEPKQRTGYF